MIGQLWDTAKDEIESAYDGERLKVCIYRPLTLEQKRALCAGLRSIVGVKDCKIHESTDELTVLVLSFPNGFAARTNDIRQTVKDWTSGYLSCNSHVQGSLRYSNC